MELLDFILKSQIKTNNLSTVTEARKNDDDEDEDGINIDATQDVGDDEPTIDDSTSEAPPEDPDIDPETDESTTDNPDDDVPEAPDEDTGDEPVPENPDDGTPEAPDEDYDTGTGEPSEDNPDSQVAEAPDEDDPETGEPAVGDGGAINIDATQNAPQPADATVTPDTADTSAPAPSDGDISANTPEAPGMDDGDSATNTAPPDAGQQGTIDATSGNGSPEDSTPEAPGMDDGGENNNDQQQNNDQGNTPSPPDASGEDGTPDDQGADGGGEGDDVDLSSDAEDSSVEDEDSMNTGDISAAMDNGEDPAKLSQADKENNIIILRRSYILLYQEIDRFIKRIADANKTNLLAILTYAQVKENLTNMRQYVYNYILFYYDKTEYDINYFNYKYFMQILYTNREMLIKMQEYNDKVSEDNKSSHKSKK